MTDSIAGQLAILFEGGREFGTLLLFLVSHHEMLLASLRTNKRVICWAWLAVFAIRSVNRTERSIQT